MGGVLGLWCLGGVLLMGATIGVGDASWGEGGCLGLDIGSGVGV